MAKEIKLAGSDIEERLPPDVEKRLEVLVRDMGPEQIKPPTEGTIQRIEALVEGVVVDLDEEIDGDVGV